MSERALTWSYGGGTQSVAIACLIANGELPVPELIVIADTAREATETWQYMEEHVQPLLDTVGAKIEIAPHDLATVGLYAFNGDLLIPAFTDNGGKLHTLCSNEWKKRVVGRYLREKGYGPQNPVKMWLGISVDEIHRAKPSGVDWIEYDWPLLTVTPRRRDECKRIVVDAGLPMPPRSACWMCPHRSDEEWKHLRDNWPEDWEAALKLEDDIRAKDDGVYLHRARVPLPYVDLNDDQHDLFDACDSGFCFV